jgi:hypothetical protein
MLIDCLRESALDVEIGVVFVPVDEVEGEALQFFRSVQGTESPVRFFVWK